MIPRKCQPFSIGGIDASFSVYVSRTALRVLVTILLGSEEILVAHAYE